MSIFDQTYWYKVILFGPTYAGYSGNVCDNIGSQFIEMFEMGFSTHINVEWECINPLYCTE